MSLSSQKKQNYMKFEFIIVRSSKYYRDSLIDLTYPYLALQTDSEFRYPSKNLGMFNIQVQLS